MKKKLESNQWAWCTVKVSCTFFTLAAENYLGCCSYKNEQAFIKHSGYYDDMVNECLSDLQRQLNEIVIAATA